MLCLARCVGTCCLLVVAVASSFAGDKSYTVRGHRVTLKESPDVLLVRPKGQKAVMDVATQSIRAQAKALDEDSPVPLVLLAKRPAQYVKVLGGVLVPKLEGVKEGHLRDIAAAAEGIDSVHSVYRVGNQHVVPMQTLTVRFKGGINPRNLFALATDFDLKEVSRPRGAAGLVRYEVPAGGDSFALCEKLAAKGYIQWAEPDLALQLYFGVDENNLPNDKLFANQWHMQPGAETVQVPEAWGVSLGRDNITVAVIDTGVDLTHPDLKPNLVAGYDFIDRDDNPQPDTGDKRISPHGTSCAGMVAAVMGNGRGIAGAAPHAKIMPIRVAGTGGFATSPDLAESIKWAQANGAKVISCSWGGPTPANQIADAIDEVTAAGALVFIAAGNDGPEGNVGFPAQFESAIAVGATTKEKKLANFSSFLPGKLVDISAPGAEIYTTDMVGAEGYYDGGEGAVVDENGDHPGDYMPSIDGTSFACPMTAGVAALVWSTYPQLTNVQLRAILQDTATKIDQAGGAYTDGYSDRYGYGQVSALAALKRAQEISGGDASQTPVSNIPQRPVVTTPPANTREILEQLLKLRKDPDASGLPKLSKDLPDPKRVILRRDQLAAVIEPQPQSYFVRGHEVKLTPSTKWFVMSLDDTGDVKGPQFWQLVRSDASDAQLKQVTIAAQGAGRVAVVAPRDVLREPKELETFIRSGTLPAVFAAYEQGGSLLVPLGTLTLRIKKDATDAKKEVQSKAATLGLRLIKEEGDVFRFAQTDTSSQPNLFAAVAELSKIDGVQWCEPDFASRPLVLPQGQ